MCVTVHVLLLCAACTEAHKVKHNASSAVICIPLIITFRVSHRRCKVYSGHGHLCIHVCICLSVPRRIPTILHGSVCKREW